MVISDARARDTVVDDRCREQQLLTEENEDKVLARKSEGAVWRRFLPTIAKFLFRWRDRIDLSAQPL
jgi:hypothetical protein